MAKLDSNLAVLLVPYVLLVIAYFNYTTAGVPSILQAVLKISPIFWLIVIVNMNGLKGNYAQYVYFAQLNAIVGDMLLVWQNTHIGVIGGILAFSLAHYSFAKALGFEPHRRDLIYKYCVPIGVANYVILFPHLFGIYAIIVPIYCCMILTMFWRSLAQYYHKRSQSAKCALIGGIFFLISDAVLGTELFSYPQLLTSSLFRIIVLNSYYCAQLAFTLSVIVSDKAAIGQRVLNRAKK